MEYLDIVNEKDEVISRDTRKNVHKKHAIHRGIHVFVINSKNEILLQKRSEKRDYYPGFWDASVGAQVLSGETYEQAAGREVKEELGFEPEDLKKVCDYKSYSKRQRENRRLFVCQAEGPFNFNKEEVELIKFWPTEKIQEEIEKGERKFTEGFKISFHKYKEKEIKNFACPEREFLIW